MKARWSSRSLGSRLQHRIFYGLIRRTGTRGAYLLLFFVVSWYALRPSIRTRGKAYLMRRFPGSRFFSLFMHTWKHQWAFGQCLVDRAAAGILGGFSFATDFRQTLRTLAGEGRGVILLAAHTGCWQMSPYALAEHSDMPVAVLVHKEQGDIDRQAHEHSGAPAPFQILDAEDGLGASIALMKVLRQGELLCTMGDRVYNGMDSVVSVVFLGSRIKMPCTAFRLASVSGSPIVCAFAVRTGPRKGAFHMACTIRVPEGLGKDAARYAPYAQQFASALEVFVRENPYQFFNFYDLWKS